MTPLKTFRNLSSSKQDRIIRIVVEEFSEKGYAGASINAMVRRLGIAKGSMFQYFGDKQGLFLFVFNSAMERVKDYLRTVRDQTRDEDLFTRLEATLLAGVIFLHKHPIVYRLYIRTLLDDTIPFRNQILASLRSYSLKYLRSLLEAARDRGELRPDLDLEKAAFVLDAVLDRFLQACVVEHLDANAGIFDCSMEDARGWITELTRMVRLGIGNG